ncbi:MAG: hypothetical protein V4547_17080 [Bacteroidota bacterium]
MDDTHYDNLFLSPVNPVKRYKDKIPTRQMTKQEVKSVNKILGELGLNKI